MEVKRRGRRFCFRDGKASRLSGWPQGGTREARLFPFDELAADFLLAGLCSAGCTTAASQASDGIALECVVCRAMWVRIDRPGDLTGDYRIEHESGRTLCTECEQIGRRFVRTGEAPEWCTACAGTLVTGVVDLTADAAAR